MRTHIICFLIIISIFINITPLCAQSGILHPIDSVMDLSPAYLPTQYAKINTIEFEPFVFQPIDTEMIAIHQFDPILKSENIYQNLGIYAQAHQSIIFDYKRDMGFLYQILPYPLYFKKQSDLSLYKLKTTYSKAAYMLTFPKTHEIFAEFAKYMNGVTVAANIYASFDEGTFVNQTSRNLCGDMLIHYEIPSSIYGFRVSYIVNSLTNRENGGLLDINAYQSRPEENNRTFEVYFTNAYSTITTHDLAIQNYVNIKDKEKRYFGTFTYDFQFGHNTIRFYNHNDTIFPCFNSDTTNDLTKIITLKNAIQWSNFSPYQEMSNKNNFFRIAVGGMHDYANLKEIYTTFNSFWLFARTHIRLFSFLDFTAQASYALSDYTDGDIIAKAGIAWTLNREKEHSFGVNGNYYRNAPEYIMQHVFVNNFRWANDFPKQNIAQLKAFWNYKKYNVSVSYYYLNKLVYLSEELCPVQNENNGNMFQLSTFIPFRYKNFGTTANLNVQYCTNDVIQVPIFAGKLSVYYIFEFFKKRLRIQLGSDFMYNTTYYADAWLPVLHKFYYQQSNAVGNFLFMDANVTVKIERLSFFFRAGNLLAPVMNYRNFTTPNYPAKDFLLSLGVSWRFFD